MNLGSGAICEFPIASAGPENSVIVTTTGNGLAITIGSIGIIADAIDINVAANPLNLGLGTLTITADSNHTVTGNATALSLGAFTVNVDVTASPSGNSLTVATGNVTIAGDALIQPSGNALTAATGEAGIITWNEIVPGANMVWTPIDPS